jgi:HNH endonuclease
MPAIKPSGSFQQLTIMEYIWRNTAFNNNGCWLFTGRKQSQGRGQLFYQGKQQLVHRVVFRIMRGKIPKGKVLMHLCDTPACFNPDHLKPATQLENMQDMYAKGRDHWSNHYWGGYGFGHIDLDLPKPVLIKNVVVTRPIDKHWRRF